MQFGCFVQLEGLRKRWEGLVHVSQVTACVKSVLSGLCVCVCVCAGGWGRVCVSVCVCYMCMQCVCVYSMCVCVQYVCVCAVCVCVFVCVHVIVSCVCPLSVCAFMWVYGWGGGTILWVYVCTQYESVCVLVYVCSQVCMYLNDSACVCVCVCTYWLYCKVLMGMLEHLQT